MVLVSLALFMTDVFGLMKATDGVLEPDEVSDLIATAKRNYPDISDDELKKLYSELLKDIKKKTGKERKISLRQILEYEST